MKIEKQKDGLWQATMKYRGRFYLGYAPTRTEAWAHCVNALARRLVDNEKQTLSVVQ